MNPIIIKLTNRLKVMRRFWHGLPRIDDHGLNWIRDSIVICILDSLSLNQPMHYALVSFRNKSTFSVTIVVDPPSWLLAPLQSNGVFYYF